jgi:hypothetical protein
MMKSWISCAVFAALTCPAWGQKVEVQKPNQGQIVHIRTALNHLTVLELKEPVVTVAVGSPAFKVEWRENKVFIQPTEENAATNLFVWTPSARFNYELDPAGPIAQMDFAIDQPPLDPPTVKASAKSADTPKGVSPADVLIGSRPVRQYGSMPNELRVAVYLRDSFEHEGQVFIRYTIQNDTKRAYTPGVPRVVALNAPRYSQSLYTLANFQLSPKEAARLKDIGATPVEVANGEIRSSRLEPGQEASGVVAVRLPQGHSGPTVLRLIFPAGPTGPVMATLVL